MIVSRKAHKKKDVKETSLTISANYGEKATGVSLDGTFSEVCESSSDYDGSISSDSNVETLGDDIIEELADQAKFANVEDKNIRQLRSGKVNSFAKTLVVQANLLKKIKSECSSCWRKTVPTPADKSFVAHLRHADVQFCFIRSKIDEDIDNALAKRTTRK
ncbi:unnamed protein product [Mytilus coruscus]|uniref:Uncharacterized protein n=1 Tax=Mytilus coruscus TaxID=42192 RepID=A0A6J8A9P0_MYTCO|nr:unnamed protein product [Mytilus coruscus]